MAKQSKSIRAQRWGMLTGALTALIVAISWIIQKTWRRILPAYWAITVILTAWLCIVFHIPTETVILVSVGIVLTASGWKARSTPVRAYRATVATIMCSLTVLIVAMRDLNSHTTIAVFVPCLMATIVGWPWWHHLRTMVVDESFQIDESLTEKWSETWRTVIEPEVLPKTSLMEAYSPRDGVVEAKIRLRIGANRNGVLRSGSDLETALFLNTGTVGWKPTGKTAILRLIMVEKSYIAKGVPWRGPTYNGGKIQLAEFADGTPGIWTAYRPGYGCLNGLVIGSTGSGKTRALGILIANLVSANWSVIIGDCQNGQSLTKWRGAVSEYHSGPIEARNLLFRLFAEAMHRSKLLSEHGIDTYDEDDPIVQELGLEKIVAIIDECQLIMSRKDKKLLQIVEAVVSICRKVGISLIFATQLPQLSGLAGSMAIRDALVAGNTFAMRLSNKGSGDTILPSGFVGDPFDIPAEQDGMVTAGMGYLRNAPEQGMLCRTPLMDEKAVAATLVARDVNWHVEPHCPDDEKTQGRASGGGTSGSNASDRMRERFGLDNTPKRIEPKNAREWVLDRLREAPMGAKALIARTDCPVNQAQIYTLLAQLVDAGSILKPEIRGGQYTIKEK